MTIKEKITASMKEAMRARDQLRLDTLRMVLSAMKNREIDKKAPLDESEAISLLGTLVKQRKESVELYRKGGRTDLADKEEQEITILKGFMPEALDAAELERIVKKAIESTGAASLADMGKVMKAVMPDTAGRADGKEVNELVRKLLSA